MVFVLSLFVPHLSFFWCLRKSALRICGFPEVSSLISLKSSLLLLKRKIVIDLMYAVEQNVLYLSPISLIFMQMHSIPYNIVNAPAKTLISLEQLAD